MAVMLTSRQVRTVEWLLDQGAPRSIAEVAADLRLSPRVIRSGLDGIERYLDSFGIELRRRRGVGVWIEASEHAIATVRRVLREAGDSETVKVYSASDRLHLALFELLTAAPDSKTVEQIQETLEVSLTSARRDLARAEPWLSAQGLFLARRPGLGVSVVGTETAIRQSLVKLLLETVPPATMRAAEIEPEWWRSPEIAAGVRPFLARIPLAACHAITQRVEGLAPVIAAGHPWLTFDLAVTAFRIRAGRPLRPEPGALRSTEDHPMWQTAEEVAAELAVLLGEDITPGEIGGITEHLLGMAHLGSEHLDADETPAELCAAVLDIATSTLHPGLAEDAMLERSLTEHLGRLRVRLRYGLPVHNPLLREVSRRYPDVHAVAQKVAKRIGEMLGKTLSDDEAGFLTMYLSGALERFRLKPRRRAVVVCPTGMATAWILVSRIQSEFPELDLVEVLAAGSVEEATPIDADLVISTVEIAEAVGSAPVVVVSPLLPTDDVRRVAREL